MSGPHLTSAAPHRLVRLALLAAVLGLAAGGAAYALVHLIGLLTNVALFGRWGWDLPSFVHLQRSPRLYVAAVLGAAGVSALARWAPVIRGHGIPEAMEAVLVRQSRIAPRAALAKPLSAGLAIGTGGPFGAEGPIIVTGGALGSLLGQVLHVTPNERKVLLASGAAAGMAATFGSPLAAVVLAIELLLFEFTMRAFVPLVVATSVAGGVHGALFGSGPLFHVPPHDFSGLGSLPLYVPLGLACGLLATLIARGLFAVEHLYRRLPVGELWHPVIGAFAFVTVGLLQPRALGVGYDAIDDVLADRLAIGVLVGLAVVKLVVWWLALGSGTSGGTLAPVLLISACVGGALGHGLERVPGHGTTTASAFALVAMAATFGAATRAPFAAMVFVFELTRDYDAILPLMLTTVVAVLVAGALLHDSLMTEKLTRRGLRVTGDYHADVLATAAVGDVMTTDVRTLSDDATVGDALACMVAGRHSAYPLVDARGRCTGIVARGDLLTTGLDDATPVRALVDDDVVVASPAEPVLHALERMLEGGVEHLPVVTGDGSLVGICTRTDVLTARRRQFMLDRPQPGWLAAVRTNGRRIDASRSEASRTP